VNTVVTVPCMLNAKTVQTEKHLGTCRDRLWLQGRAQHLCFKKKRINNAAL
jgi:hypothetical protein